MRSIHGACLIALLFAATVNLGLAAVARAESDVLAWDPPTGLTLSFDPSKDTTGATGSAILRNPSPFPLAVTLRLVGGDDLEALSLTPARFAMKPASAMQVDLRIPGAEALVGVKGSIVAEGLPPSSNIGVGPAVVGFEIVGTDTKPTKMLAEPASVTMTVDRCAPSFLVGVFEFVRPGWAADCLVGDRTSAPVTVHGIGDLSGAPDTWDLSGEDGVLELSISKPVAADSAEPVPTTSTQPSAAPQASASAEQTPSPAPALLIQVVHPGPAGKYAGDIPTSVGVKDTPTIPTTVHVQDHVFWPLLAILISALLAYWLVPRRSQARSRDVLIGRLVEIFEETGDRSCLPLGAFPLPQPPAPQPGSTIKPRWPSVPTPTPTPAEKLYTQIVSAGTDEELQRLAKVVEDLAPLVELWRTACTRRTTLQALLDEIQAGPDPIAPGTPILEATADLLDDPDPFETTEGGTAHATALKDQAEAVQMWDQARAVARDAIRVWTALHRAALPADKQAILDSNNPAVVQRTHLLPARDLENLKELEPERRLREQLQTLMTLAEAAHVDVEQVHVEQLDERPRRRLAPRRARRIARPEPAASIGERIKRGDRFQFVCLTVAVALVYLGTIYPGHDFGSSWHYMTAILAGVTGAVAIRWELLPWSRSYRPVLPKP